MLKKKLIYLEILASLLLYGCSPSVKQTQAAAEKTDIFAHSGLAAFFWIKDIRKTDSGA